MCNPFLLCVVLVFTADRDETQLAKAPKVALEREVGDLQGYYVCKGVEGSGKTYSGVAVITKKNEVYVIQWVVGSASTFTGIGIRQSNTFAASWAMPNDKGGIIRGVNQYRIESGSDGPRLVGRWATLPGSGVMQSETLTYLRQLEPEE